MKISKTAEEVNWMFSKFNKVKMTGWLAVLLVLFAAVGVAGYTPNEITELAGAWRTAEEDEAVVTLLLYPDDAFRLHIYDQDANSTQMLEGAYIVENGEITVSEIRLGILDAEGAYTQTGEMETMFYLYTITQSDTPMLALTFDDMETYFLYPFDMDGPGE